MRNIYNTYRMCKNIKQHADVHKCDDKLCPARGKIGTSRATNASKFKKVLKKRPDTFISDYTWWMRYEQFAEAKKYIYVDYCESNQITFVSIADKGVELTDNIFLPLTPIGLWKAIWSEHKIFFTSVIAVITATLIKIISII